MIKEQYNNRQQRLDDFNHQILTGMSDMYQHLKDLTLVGKKSIKFGKGWYDQTTPNKLDIIVSFLERYCESNFILLKFESIAKEIPNNYENIKYDFQNNNSEIFRNDNDLDFIQIFKNGGVKVAFNNTYSANDFYEHLKKMM